MVSSFEDYQDLSGVGFQGGGSEPTAPEEEFFHSIYISGKRRTNHLNTVEEPGKIQIRGVSYNLDEVHMIITHTKDILAKITKDKTGKETIECFSYKDGPAPWYGTTTLPNGNKRVCPLTSAERAANEFCNACRAQIIVGGIFCEETGRPIPNPHTKKKDFVFLRGRGMRYSNISEYLNDRFNEDMTPIFEPVTEQSKHFEKSVVNNKRYVVKITKGSSTSSFGNDVNVFVLEKGIEIPKDSVLKILKMSKDTVEKFNEKFDWSKRKTQGTVKGYGSTPPEGILEIGEDADTVETKSQATEEKKAPFSFDTIDF